MRICDASSVDLEAVLSLAAGPGVIGMTAEALRAELDAGRMRPEWTWVAHDAAGALVGRAVWWGRDATAPIALDVLDVVPKVTTRHDVAVALLRAGQKALNTAGVRMPLPHTVRLPLDWRGRPDSVDALAWRQHACAAVGLTQATERHQFEWTGAAVGRLGSGRFMFRPAPNEEFLSMFAAAAQQSLDVLTQRTLVTSTPEQLARDELEYYLSCPGERAWWRIATDESGAAVGLAIPSATPHSRNVGYLAVLPGSRGRGYVDDLLAYVTGFHRGEGATRITATTDAVNVPMANAFRRAGYRHVETRVELEP